MKQRMITGAVLVALLIVLLYFGGAVMSVTAMVCICFAVYEEYHALALAGLVHADGDGPLCFRPLRPRLEGQLHVVWKRGVVFSRAPELFLRELRAKIAAEGAASPK